MARKNGVEGEGSYSGTRNYNQRTKKFVESGKVAPAARRARPANAKDAREMEQAERAGRRRARH
jgi:hypothetical protein